MITYIEIDGFKTFHQFKTELGPFVLVAGANGSGKSNLFDVFRLLSRLTETDLKTAFNEQRGSATELFTQFPDGTTAQEMKFLVEMLVNKTIKDKWGGVAHLKYTRLCYELHIKKEKNDSGIEQLLIKHESLNKIDANKDEWIEKYIPKHQLNEWRPKVTTGKRVTSYISTSQNKKQLKIQIHQDGKREGKSILADVLEQTSLSNINSVDFPHIFAAQQEMKNWRFLQLNPIKLREPSSRRFAHDTITTDGRNLAAALHRIKRTDDWALQDISSELNNLLPTFTNINVIEDLARDQFVVMAKTEDNRTFSAGVLSEGTLRLLALCTLKYDVKHSGVLCFEEPENGIHPYRLKYMVQLLQDLSTNFDDEVSSHFPLRQVITNTHSPILLGKVMEENHNYVILFAFLATLMLPEMKAKMTITKVKRVVKELNLRHMGEDPIAKSEVIQYLQIGDFKEVTNNLTKRS